IRFLSGHQFITAECEAVNGGAGRRVERIVVESNTGAAVNGTETLDLIGLVSRIQMQCDDSARPLRVFQRRYVNTAVSPDGQMPDCRTESFRDNSGVKARGQPD